MLEEAKQEEVQEIVNVTEKKYFVGREVEGKMEALAYQTGYGVHWTEDLSSETVGIYTLEEITEKMKWISNSKATIQEVKQEIATEATKEEIIAPEEIEAIEMKEILEKFGIKYLGENYDKFYINVTKNTYCEGVFLKEAKLRKIYVVNGFGIFVNMETEQLEVFANFEKSSVGKKDFTFSFEMYRQHSEEMKKWLKVDIKEKLARDCEMIFKSNGEKFFCGEDYIKIIEEKLKKDYSIYVKRINYMYSDYIYKNKEGNYIANYEYQNKEGEKIDIDLYYI